METIKGKHIIIGLVIAFILFLFYWIGDEDYSYDQTRNHTQGAIQSHTSYHSFDIEHAYSSTGSHNPSTLTRHEILQTNVKGYREETYWGEEHPTHEKIKHFSDDEFDDYLEEVEQNDADVYWGAEY